MGKAIAESYPGGIDRWEHLVQTIGIVVGSLTILLPVFLYRRSGTRRKVDAAVSQPGITSWPGMFLATLGYVLFGIAAWRPLPLKLREDCRKLSTSLGSLLYFPGLLLYWWGQRTLGDLFRPSTTRRADLYVDHRLVEVGPYALVRHPMYLGVLLAAGGALLIYRTWTMVFYSISSLAVVARARREEAALAGKFGPEWEAYRARVPGWLPVRPFERRNG